MSVIYILIVASLLFAGGFLAAFLWAVRSGQFDDKYTPSVRILFDEKPPEPAQPHSANDTSVNEQQPSSNV